MISDQGQGVEKRLGPYTTGGRRNCYPLSVMGRLRYVSSLCITFMIPWSELGAQLFAYYPKNYECEKWFKELIVMIIITTHIYLGLMSLFTEGKALEVNEVHNRKGDGKWINTKRFYVVDKCRIFTRQYVTFFCLCNNFRDQSKALKTPWRKTNAYGQVTFVYVCLYVSRQLDESFGIPEMTLLIAY